MYPYSDRFKQAANQIFAQSLLEHFLAVTQTASVCEYITRFRYFAHRLLNADCLMPDAFLVRQFVAGLQPSCQAYVRARRVHSDGGAEDLENAYLAALNFDKLSSGTFNELCHPFQ